MEKTIEEKVKRVIELLWEEFSYSVHIYLRDAGFDCQDSRDPLVSCSVRDLPKLISQFEAGSVQRIIYLHLLREKKAFDVKDIMTAKMGEALFEPISKVFETESFEDHFKQRTRLCMIHSVATELGDKELSEASRAWIYDID